jgi:hypothetical protein
MTKTEFKKRLVALAIEQLENEFGVEFTGDDEGGRLGFTTVAGFRGDFSVAVIYGSVHSGSSIQIITDPVGHPIEVVKRSPRSSSIRKPNKRGVRGIPYE